MSKINYLEYLQQIADSDVAGLTKAQQSYGDSWIQRGGIGAFMMLARKWDRLEKRVSQYEWNENSTIKTEKYDIIGHAMNDERAEGIIDDIRDLRRYLLLVEAELLARGFRHGTHRDNVEVNLTTHTKDPKEFKKSSTGQEHPFGYDPAEEFEITDDPGVVVTKVEKKIQCRHCHGRGETFVGSGSATARSVDSWRSCIICKGTGWVVKCESCDGTGKWAFTRDKQSMTTCPKCKGHGVVTIQEP